MDTIAEGPLTISCTENDGRQHEVLKKVRVEFNRLARRGSHDATHNQPGHTSHG